MALGASFAGKLGVTATSGPGMDLKAETIGLAVMLELPMVIIDVQRAGPSTGMPTKTEQADLLMAIHGRHGESPLPVIAPSTPADCFDVGGRSGPGRGPLPDAGDPARRHLPRQLLRALADPRQRRPAGDRSRLRRRRRTPATSSCPTCATSAAPGPGRSPGTPGLQHRLGGLEKEDGSGNISYDPANHALMTELRAEQAREAGRGAARSSRSTPTRAPSCWSSAGARPTAWSGAAARRVRETRHPDRDRPPAPRSTRCRPTPARSSARFPKVLIPELNTGQLLSIIRAEFLVDAVGYNKVEGLPILAEEMERAILEVLS